MEAGWPSTPNTSLTIRSQEENTYIQEACSATYDFTSLMMLILKQRRLKIIAERRTLPPSLTSRFTITKLWESSEISVDSANLGFKARREKQDFGI